MKNELVTMEERNNKLICLITCMKCEMSGKCCDENCPIQYKAGTMGEIIKNLEEISKILTEMENTEKEIAYCENDVLVASAYIQGEGCNGNQRRLNTTKHIVKAQGAER